MDQFEYKNYLDSIVLQLRKQFADSSLMILNFRDEGISLVSGLFSLCNVDLKKFINASGADVRSLSALYVEVGRSADALSHYFGEDPAKSPFEQVNRSLNRSQGSGNFMGWLASVLPAKVASTLLTFVGLFRKAHEENLKQIEAEKKKAQKEAEKEANQDRPIKSKDGLVHKSPRSAFR